MHLRRIYLTLLLSSFLYPWAAWASCPGEGCQQGPLRCTVIGYVDKIENQGATALVSLQQLFGSNSYSGCEEDYGDKVVSVSLDAQPKPDIDPGDLVLVELGGGSAASLAAPQRFDQILSEAQIYYNNPKMQISWTYQIKSFLGVPLTIQKLEALFASRNGGSDIESTVEDRRLSAALLLILLAKKHFQVPHSLLHDAFILALTRSYRCSDVAPDARYLSHNAESLVGRILDLLTRQQENDGDSSPFRHDTCIFSAIIALGELGPPAKRALPEIMKFVAYDDKEDAGKTAAAIADSLKNMNAENESVKLLLENIRSGKLKSRKNLPIPLAVCSLVSAPASAEQKQLKTWCDGAS